MTSSGRPGEFRVVERLANGDDQRDPLRQQPTPDERHGLCRHVIEPLGIVDDNDQGLVLGRVGEQAQDGEPDQEPIRNRAGAETEGGAEGVTLWIGQSIQLTEERGTQLVEPAVRQLHLGFDAGRPCRRKPATRPRRSSSNAVLPIPACPRSTRTPLVPPFAPATS